MFVISAAATVPLPWAIEQVVLAGLVITVTEYAPPAAIGVANVKLVVRDGTVRLSPPLS
jgi:hypothetical protein